ncbi:hypothetical protein [Arthrobacter caoxuetaonis]|uniref:Uncharacterized protein n=1 Tax=Arthrobacter caoxuetaonis TaxID=2886935 RepID=A0A9X1MI03_9MICC|nr:hypothetical protein [Arthrobacter caoxuetaonis]MCC3299242.1 hypothetical protein [Arthrobacter caoxuetaonis]USQ59264.1 hypothetical protein NF551_16910 [Arthrobacter caoxuetaonis]
MPDNASVANVNTYLVRTVSTMPSTDPDYGQWWGTEAGQSFYREIAERVGRPIAYNINRQYGVSYEAADVANTAFTMLHQEFISAYIQRSEDPWAYLSTVLKREMISEIGGYFRTELTEAALYEGSTAVPVRPAATVAEAAELTAAALAQAAPAFPLPILQEAVFYFAERGHQRLSHLYTEATNDPELTSMGLVREEILAIANAVLGSRPDNELNSLMAAYLMDPAFDPKSSIRHRRALKKFATRIAKSHHQEMRQLVG